MALFAPPEASAGLCEDVPFDSASDTAIDNKAGFDAFDRTPQGKNDPVSARPCSHFLMEQFSGVRRWRSMQMVPLPEWDDSADRNWTQTGVRMTRRFTSRHK